MDTHRPLVAGIATLMLIALLATPRPAGAQLPGMDDDRKKTATDLVKVRMVSTVESVAPGQELLLALVFDIEPHWHIYWRNPGDSGAPTSIEIEGPAGFEIGAVRWPRPEVFTGPEGRTIGYERRTVLFVPVTAPADLPEGPVTFEAEVDWLVCKRACLMGSATRKVALPTSEDRSADRDLEPVLAEFHRRLPAPLDDLEEAIVVFDGETLSISGPAPGAERVDFLPADRPGVTFGIVKGAVEDGVFHLRIPVEVKPENAMGEPLVLDGLLIIDDDPDDPAYSFARPLESP